MQAHEHAQQRATLIPTEQAQQRGTLIPTELRLDLTLGISSFENALQTAYPNLPPVEIEILGNALLGRISDSIIAGEHIASVRQNPNGQVELRVWTIGPLDVAISI